MASSTSSNGNVNCIKMSDVSFGQREFVQYGDKGNIVYYYRSKKKFMNNFIITVHDMQNKEIGSIGCINNWNLITYNFYDENKKIKFYIETIKNCCTDNYTFYGEDKNIITSIISKKAYFYCDEVYDEYDKYNTKTNGVIGKKGCASNRTYYESDANGSSIFIIRQFYFLGRFELKIYDPNENEINLGNCSMFNNGFTNIQKLLLILVFFESDS